MSGGSDVFWRQWGRSGRLDDGGVGWRVRAEYGVEVAKECGEDAGWDVEGRGKDDADVSTAHLVDAGVVDDADQEGREGPDERPVGKWQPMDQYIEASDPPAPVIVFCVSISLVYLSLKNLQPTHYSEELQMQFPCEYRGWKLT